MFAKGNVLAENQSSLTQWANRALGMREIKVQARLRGNNLHILCEGSFCPDVRTTVAKFSTALEVTNLDALLPNNHHKIYQVFLCGRQMGARRPEWTIRLWRSGIEVEGHRVSVLNGSHGSLSTKLSLKDEGLSLAEPPVTDRGNLADIGGDQFDFGSLELESEAFNLGDFLLIDEDLDSGDKGLGENENNDDSKSLVNTHLPIPENFDLDLLDSTLKIEPEIVKDGLTQALSDVPNVAALDQHQNLTKKIAESSLSLLATEPEIKLTKETNPPNFGLGKEHQINPEKHNLDVAKKEPEKIAESSFKLSPTAPEIKLTKETNTPNFTPKSGKEHQTNPEKDNLEIAKKEPEKIAESSLILSATAPEIKLTKETNTPILCGKEHQINQNKDNLEIAKKKSEKIAAESSFKLSATAPEIKLTKETNTPNFAARLGKNNQLQPEKHNFEKEFDKWARSNSNKNENNLDNYLNTNYLENSSADLIANHLNESLGILGVAVKVSICSRDLGDDIDLYHDSRGLTLLDQSENNNQEKSNYKRLWVICESSYIPDPSLIGEPIAQQVRKLNLKGFRDAAIALLVRGENKLEWILRVDLTPPDLIIKEWARWGETQAITRLLNDKLADLGMGVRATLKASTLHLFCYQIPASELGHKNLENHQKSVVNSGNIPDKKTATEAIALFLATLAPQGIYAATVYGVSSASEKLHTEKPAWIDWLNLPAAQHPDLAPSPKTLASQGDRSALLFLLDRLLNPDLEKKLQTGGIRVVILLKSDLIHIMTESFNCPLKSEVAPRIIKCLRKLNIAGITGVRVYGRRAGEKRPVWRYRTDFVARSSQVTDLMPQFTTTEREIGLNLPQQSEYFALSSGDKLDNFIDDENSNIERQDINIENEHSWQNWQQWLIRSGLFAAALERGQNEQKWNIQRSGMALIYSLIGCLLIGQIDRELGLLITLPEKPIVREKPATIVTNNAPIKDIAEAPIKESKKPEKKRKDRTLPLPKKEEKTIFNNSQFTKIGSNSLTLTNCSASTTDTGSGLVNNTGNNSSFLVASDSDMKAECAPENLNPSPNLNLRSPQLEAQYQRYLAYLANNNGPPDVLIIGSSRALRGIDPSTLEENLVSHGYPNLKVYNFGVNGATMQVVELIIRRLLSPEQLPKMIILADGVRAFNSGRMDVTYSSIAASEGYKNLKEGGLLLQSQTVKKTVTPKENSTGFWGKFGNSGDIFAQLAKLETLAIENHSSINQQLVTMSAAYNKRDEAKALLGKFTTNITTQILPKETLNTATNLTEITPQNTQDNLDLESNNDSYKPNGFLPLSLRFNPINYYKNHPLVTGDYDNDYADFQLMGKQTEYFNTLVDYTQELKIKLVFVNMPLTKTYLDPVRTNYEEQFRQYMQEKSQEKNITFIDFVNLWPEANDNFSDPSHLNRYGALAVSKKLAEDTTIQWPHN